MFFKRLVLPILLLSTPISASAVTVNVDGIDWEISTIYGSYEDNVDLLRNQVWYGDSELSNIFAQTATITAPPELREGPNVRFLWAEPRGFLTSWIWIESLDEVRRSNDTGREADYVWAIAGEVSPVPIPASALLLIGGLGALGVARSRRGRKTA